MLLYFRKQKYITELKVLFNESKWLVTCSQSYKALFIELFMKSADFLRVNQKSIL